MRARLSTACPALAFGVALMLAGCGRKQVEPPPPVRPVLNLVVEPTAAQPLRAFTGTVQPRYEAQLGFQMTGRMISRDVDVGDRVTKGQQLATLDPTVPRLALASAQADLANAQAQLTNAEATNKRQQELIKTGSVSQAQVDASVAANQAAQAKVTQARAALTKSQDQLSYTALKSDYDGVVASWNAEVGQIVSAGQTVVMVARPEIRDAVFDIPDDLMDRFHQGSTFTVTLLADASLSAQGEVREIAPQSDPETRTRRVRLTLLDPSDAFRLGTTVRIVLSGKEEPRIEVPQSAILERDGKSSVWLVGPGSTAVARPVVLGPRTGALVSVASGLQPGDRVITAGVHSLSEGQPITLPEP